MGLFVFPCVEVKEESVELRVDFKDFPSGCES